ncbi:ADP-heptose--lipooligosaccharide heptosyltransferase II [Paramagnetospirillum magnetotacticum MS-1]|uniref:ADP-heptose--lipooligosaccharide heptosyltransferase II n=1 Tax=Paramagnetospirillum magnetotacticum MS-1 TaxID=272627 RepID=A0A0C2UY14_PARME|nr:glycosyltransferase family 9 protein [Paramagnetospirillum magnetotacticum]KIL97701.1 ADP-heptose--lipooligosaccharide heptosyltransferase II [Paramagnetospirillum magnetotacticum MS-1]
MRILFVTASRIGDAVLSTGLLAHLAERYPKARFTVACGQAAAGLFQSAPFVDKVIPMVKRRRAGHWIELWRQTAGIFWHQVIDLRGSALGWLVPTMSRKIIKSSWEPKHRLLHLSALLGLDHPLPPVLWSTPDQEAQAARLMGEGPILALGPGANWTPKQWPAERFAQLAGRLTGDGGILAGAKVALFGAESERPSLHALIEAVPIERRLDLIGRVDLATIHACLKRASLYVGNDSGLMHIAAASHVPTLGLFGPSSEVFYGPFGPLCAAVRGARSFEDICHAPDFNHRRPDCLMLDLDVDKVAEAAAGLMAGGRA